MSRPTSSLTRSPQRVEQLQDGPIPDGDRVVGRRGIEDALHVLRRQHVRQVGARAGRVDQGRDVAGGDALPQRESVEAAHGRALARLRAAPGAGPLEAPHEIDERLRIVAPARARTLSELGKVTAVGLDGERRQAALDAELDEEGVDRIGQARVGHCAARSSASAAACASSPAPSPPSIAASSRVRSSGPSRVASRRRSPAGLPLADHDVRVGVRGNLREVRHAQHLVVAAQGPEALPQRRCVPAADPGVDLVEDEERRLVGRGQHDLQRQRQPAGLTSRRDSRQRPRRLSGVRCERERRTIGAMRADLDRIELDAEGAGAEPERRKLGVHRLRQPIRRGAPRRGQLTCRLLERRASLDLLGAEPLARSLLVLERLELGGGATPRTR